ncbi:MAG: hypothetical protein Harvfovirus3_64 [Harvfovirus sp.]|uniref:Uncharacterized protein n=1 Tax=Harvfovirus sp. TaxID=2487768 RepID=A0A3G5A549_9VIRU|nr:MAG: hypothetical protein Harvfovirus3_64 [Harvfovirus sp.]
MDVLSACEGGCGRQSAATKLDTCLSPPTV